MPNKIAQLILATLFCMTVYDLVWVWLHNREVLLDATIFHFACLGGSYLGLTKIVEIFDEQANRSRDQGS